MHRLNSINEGSLHPALLSDNNHDDLGNPRCCNWAAGVQMQLASLRVRAVSVLRWPCAQC